MTSRLLALWAAALALGCSSDDTAAPAGPAGADGPAPGSPTSPCEGCTPPGPGPATIDLWAPGEMRTTPRGPNARGFLDRRGLIHAHSVYSHDACDGEPRENETGPINQPCFDDFRAALCRVKHDFVMLTDHRGSFADTEFPDLTLYRPERGDTLVERGANTVANHAACDDGWSTLIMPGTESATMTVNLDAHPSADIGERSSFYGDSDPATIARLRELGGVVLMAHPETFTVDELAALELDGFEMYNLHANLLPGGIGAAMELIGKLREPELLPQSDLVLLPIVQEDPKYLERWGNVLARGQRIVTTLGTDCHQNTFPDPLPDGERIDSYRRMMQWFSNHLLVQASVDGRYDDEDLADALRAGRLYGTFDVFGYPQGFDFRADVGGAATEMGGAVALAEGPELVVERPRLEDLDPTAEAPVLRLRILRAIHGVEGFEEVAAGAETLRYTPTAPGAYRAEVRITPRHLAPYLSSYAPLAEREFVWIYSNAIHVEG